ncbi:protein TASOR 2 isoform X4 [Chanodichthys erythropterus]|uniref:protein TASOR 2 isoform X4 n=1 Tax=Chanodichthys erythropterus TaxID=933992 RepID=UPI00351E7D27
MENVTTRSTQGNWGLLEPVHPGSVTFNESILAPLRDNYLYEESKECFTYNSAHLINNDALQKRYAAFRSEKREKGYSEQELEESFGFLLLDDANRARKVGETGLLVGKAKCTTLGDPLKGFYISKYSDCLDLKRWYDGKTGYIVLLKLTKGRVKDVTDNYTQNFTPPTPGFDCHVSDQLGAVSSTTSSFLAYERTQYYMYELRDGSSKAESCPRHACPFAIVAFSYGKMSTTSELEQKSQDKTVFHYQPWIGQFKIESTVYDVGLQSASGAWFPAKLPKTVQIDHAIGVSELKRTLPREIFETCIVGEVCIDGRCFNLYDVVSSKAKNDLAQIAHELKEKDMALVIPLEDSGFLILLHSSHLFSYEDAKSGKAAALQGMFIFPDSRTVPRDAKSDLTNTKVSSEIMQVIPALNYAETEMGKCPPNQQGCSKSSLEKCLQEYGTLFHPGLLDVPTREASMFPDQFDVPGGFTLISPKWSQETGTRLKSYFDEPCGFTIPVVRALELLTTGRQQRGDDHDDDVYYCISSPEEVPQTDAPVESETSHRTVEKVEKQKDANKHLSTEQPQPALPDGLGKLGTAVVTVADSVLEDPTSTVSPKLGDVPTENCVSIDTDVDKTSQGSTKGDADEVCVDLSTKETHVHTSSTPLITSTEEVGTAGRMEDNIHPEKTMADHAKKVNRRSFSRRKGRKRKIHWRTMKIKKGVKKKVDLPSSSLPLVLPVNSTDDPTKEQTPSETMHADDINQRPHSTRRGKGRRQRRVNRNLSEAKQTQEPLSVSTETILDQSIKNETSPSKRDWRSLPRRKRLWNTDANLKRSLRSAAAKIEETIVNAQADTTKQSLSSAPKRKMEGFSLRERYGLKTIITTCGRVFVPHGSDVDVQSANKRQSEKMHVEMNMDTNAETVSPVENKSTEIVESKGESPSMVMEELPCKNPVVIDGEDMAHSPSSEMPSALLSALNILRKLNKNNPLETDKSKDLCSEKSMNATSNENVGLQQTNKDHPVTVQTDATSSPPRESDQSMLSDPKVSSPDKIKKKTKHSVYSAISISKLKTVLRRGKRAKSPSPGNSAKSEPDKAEPESKIRKLDTVVDLKCDIIKNELKDKGSQPMNDKEQHAPMKPVEITKQPVSWRGLIHKATKENGLSGPPPQVSSPSGCVDSPLSLKTGLHLNLPKDGAASCHQEEGGKTEWKHLISADKPMSFIPKTKARKSRFLRNRRIIEKEGKIQVMRIWEEDYDFKFDSKFTNDSIDKTVTRALHGKWNFSIEDTFEDVHIIFHMWIGLFYSKHTSRLFHLENSTALPKGKDVEKVHLDINAIQNAVSLLNVELSSKEDSSRSVPLSTEVLDLSVKNGEPVNLCSVSNQSRIKDTASHPGGISPTCKHEKAPSHSPSGRSLSLNPKVTTMMSYRSTVDLPVENSVPDSDTETDDENDITTDCSYSQLLERNSAYNQLCEQASNMRIGIRLLLPKVRNVTNTEASTRVSTVDLKKIGVFHQVLSPVKPSAFSKPHRLILGRKSFALSLKNETGHVEHAVLQKENVSVNAESKEISKTNRSKDECPEAVVDGNVDDTRHRASISVQEKSVSVSEESKEVSDEDSQDGCLTIMEDGNVEEIMTSKSPSQDQISIAEHKCSAHAKEDLKLLEDLKGHANKVDDLRDASLLETNVEEHNETSNAKKEHQPLLDDTNLVDHADVLSDISSDGTRVEEYNETSNAKEDLKPVHDHLKDQPKMVDELRDATSDGTSVEEHIETSHAKKELKPLLDDTNLVDHFDKLSDTSSDETRVVENETSNAKDLKPVHDLKEHTADELRGATSDETKVEKCKEISSAKEEHDPKDQLNLIDASSHAIEGNDTKEPVEEDEGYTGEELMQEGESKSKEWDNLDGRDTEHETSIVMVERLDEIVLGLKDDINSVDMEFSDDDDDDDDVQTQKSETQPQTPEETYLEDYALELSSDSCSADDEPMSVQEKHTPDSDIDSLEGMQDEIETKTLQQSLVVQQEALEVCQNELKPASTVEPTKLDISKSEKDDERDLGQQDTSKVSAEVDTIVDEETKSQGSCEDEVIKTYQECALPPNILTDSRNEMVAPHALTVDKPSEVEVNSMCSTPTQDEMACFSEVHEHLYFPDNTVCVDKLPPKISVTPHTHVSTTKPFSDFIGHNEETHNDELRWKYPGTMDFKDESALTIKCSPSEDPFQLRQNKLCPTSQQKDDENSNFIEGATQNDSELFYREDNVDDLPGYYQGSDEGLPWTDYQIEEPVDHQLYPCEIEFSGDNDQPICSKYITSERKYSYRHKKRARKEFDNYCWEEKKYKLDPLSVTFTAEYTREQSPKKKSRKSKFTVSRQNSAWDEEGIVDYSIQKTCSKPTREVTVSSLPHVKTSKQQFDWSRYFRREAASSQLLDVSERDDKFDIPPSSIVTILDRKGNRVTFSNSPTMKPSFIGLENSLNDWQEQQSMADVTRSAVDLEYLIFSKKMNQVLKENKKVRAQSSSSTTSHCWSNPNQATCPMTIQFSNLGEVENSVELSKAQSSITDFKIKVDMSDKREMEPVRNRKPHLQRLFCEKGNEVEFAGISEITKQCAVTYKSMMNDVCSRKTLPRPVEASGKGIKRKYNRESVGQHPGFCGRIKKDTFNNPHDNIKSFVRQASKTKYRFFILVTSTDTFFEETKHLLEIEGHIPVEPNEFNLSDDCQSPLLIILRNEDIAEHICEVPCLLELKKSPNVLFAGIDRPDDVVNLAHQELFEKGGFIVCDELALDTLTLDDMKKVVGILEELDKQGKWKWFLHYRDSRRLRESARSSPEGSKKQQFIDFCQKAGIVEVLPYHECDVISRDRPDYLFCLTRLQIQNASVRFPVFITDTPTESFGTNGILTMNIYTFSRILSNDTCSVS